MQVVGKQQFGKVLAGGILFYSLVVPGVFPGGWHSGLLGTAHAEPVGMPAAQTSAGLPAEDSPDQVPQLPIETLVVTGSHSPQPLELMPGSVDVLTREEIRASHADGVVELLRQLPGLHIEQAATRGSLASIYMRGLDPNHTLVLLDGIVVNDPTNARGGSFDLSTLDVLNLEQIEVVRGPVSAVHGSAAVAGAINIRTGGGKGPDEVRADISGGRWGYHRLMASARGQRGPVDLAIAGSFVEEGVPEELGGYRGGSVVVSGGLALPGEGEMRTTLRYGDSRSQAYPIFSGGPQYAELVGQFETREVGELDFGATLDQPLGDTLDVALWVTTTQRQENLVSPGVPMEVPGEPGTRTRFGRTSLTGRLAWTPLAGLTLTAGGDAVWEDGSSSGDLEIFGLVLPGAIDFRERRFVGAPFVEGHWTTDFGLTLQAGVRVDVPDDFSSRSSSRFSATWEILDTGLSLNGSWGQGFKLPSFYALGNPVVGNPDLVPETSQGWDAGLGYALLEERLQLSMTYFQIGVRDLIDFNSDSFQLQNLSEVESRGAEAQALFSPIASLSLTAHATWNEVREQGTSTQLLNRPRWRGGLGLLWRPLEPLEIRLQALFVGPLRAESVPTGVVTLPGYQRLDLAASWQLLSWLEGYLALDNLLDQQYQEQVGIRTPGIRPRIGFRIELF